MRSPNARDEQTTPGTVTTNAPAVSWIAWAVALVWLVGLTNDVGLLSEEYDMGGHRMAGNFPQAYSHLALVQAARTLAAARRVVSGDEPVQFPDQPVHTNNSSNSRHLRGHTPGI